MKDEQKFTISKRCVNSFFNVTENLRLLLLKKHGGIRIRLKFRKYRKYRNIEKHFNNANATPIRLFACATSGRFLCTVKICLKTGKPCTLEKLVKWIAKKTRNK